MDYFAGLDIAMDETHISSPTAMELLPTRASRHRWLRRSRTSCRKRRAVVGSSLRPGEWRRSCSTG